tara:strand:+ start:74 stop:220 length:147 start_codon:yes stop_codon:yes gene_type:complete
MITLVAYLIGALLGFFFGKFHERAIWIDERATLIEWAESKIEEHKNGE